MVSDRGPVRPTWQHIQLTLGLWRTARRLDHIAEHTGNPARAARFRHLAGLARDTAAHLDLDPPETQRREALAYIALTHRLRKKQP